MTRKSMVWFIDIRGRAANAAARWLNGFSSRVRDSNIYLPCPYIGAIYIYKIACARRKAFFILHSSLFVLPSSFFPLPSSLFVLSSSFFPLPSYLPSLFLSFFSFFFVKKFGGIKNNVYICTVPTPRPLFSDCGEG